MGKKKFWPACVVAVFVLSSSVQAFELSETFRDRKYGYSIKYPSAWKARKYRSGVILAEINSDDGKSGLQIRFIPSDRMLEDFVLDYEKGFIKEMEATLTSRAAITIDRIRGYESRFHSGRTGTEYYLKSYCLPARDGSGYYVFQCGTPFENRDPFDLLIDEIAFSFKVK